MLKVAELRSGIIALLLPLCILGCAQPDSPGFKQSVAVHHSESMQSTEAGTQSSQGSSEERIAENKIYAGTGIFTKPTHISDVVSSEDQSSYSLTFKNTDIRIILRAVLSDTLKIPYSIDPRVQGTATLETSGPISKDGLRDTLESLLKTKGYALVETATGMHILPFAEAPQKVSVIHQGLPASVNLPGFGVQVVPLTHVSPHKMSELLEPFAPRGSILRIDNARGFLVLGGTTQELSSILRAIDTFDVNWMSGMSFGFYDLKHASVEDIQTEIDMILSQEAEGQDQFLRLVPIERLNKLLVITPRAEFLKQIEFWLSQLDVGQDKTGRKIFVYPVKHGRAVDLASTLNLLLGGDNTRSRDSSFASQVRSDNSRVNDRRNQQRDTGNSDSRTDDNRRSLIVADQENNSLVMYVSSTEMETIETALKQLDISPKQVLIEVTLAEVSLTDELRYGLQWNFEFGENSVSLGTSSTPTSEFPGFSWGYTNNSSASAVLNALDSITDVQVISSPKMLVINNQPATLQIGDEVPVPTASSISTNDPNAPIVNSIAYRTTGVILTVTPRINDGGMVVLDVEQEVSNVVRTSSSGIDAPTIQQRRVKSSVAVLDGNTIALGGLIKNSKTKSKSGVPLLKDIPLLGAAFRNTSVVEDRTELIVLLTPRVMRDVDQQREVMDSLQLQFETLFPDFEKGPSGAIAAKE